MLSKDLKKKKEQKAAALKQEDIKLYRLMIEFILGVILVSAIIAAGNGNEIYIVGKILPVTNVITAVIFAASAILFVLVKRRGVDESGRIVTTAGIFGNAAVLFFSSAHYYLFMDAKQLSLALVIVILLYFVYSIYDRRFFDYSLFTALGFLALQHSMLSTTIFSNFAILLVKAATVLAIAIPLFTVVRAIVRKIKGKLTTKLLICIILSSLVTIGGAVLAMFYPAAVIYAIFALLAVYLATTVVYTVRMM